MEDRDHKNGWGKAIGKVRKSDLLQLGSVISQEKNGISIWILIAEGLNLPEHRIEEIENSKSSNPGYDVLNYCKGDDSRTLEVLRNIFKNKLQRNDLVETLEEIRLEIVSICLKCFHNGEEKEMSENIPGDRTLRDHFKSKCQQLGISIDGKRCTLISTVRLQWTSPARDCQGKHCIVYVTQGEKPSVKKRQSETPPSKPSIDSPKRNAISNIEDKTIFPPFDVSDSPETDVSLHAEAMTRAEQADGHEDMSLQSGDYDFRSGIPNSSSSGKGVDASQTKRYGVVRD